MSKKAQEKEDRAGRALDALGPLPSELKVTQLRDSDQFVVQLTHTTVRLPKLKKIVAALRELD